MNETDCLTGEEVLMLVEALDAFIPVRGNNSWLGGDAWTDEQMERFGAFDALRERLKHQGCMGFFDEGRTFLEHALRDERYGLTQALHGRLLALLKQDNLTRRQLREGMVAAFQELRDVRYFQTKMPR